MGLWFFELLDWSDYNIIRHRIRWLCLLVDKKLYGWNGNIWTGKTIVGKKED
jgi:hypothetical protein